MHPNAPFLKSFVEVAADSHFPIQNLPFGVFSTVVSVSFHLRTSAGGSAIPAL